MLFELERCGNKMRVYALSEDIYLHYNDLNTWEINIKNENFEINILNHGVILSLLPFLEVGREKIIEKIGDLQKWLVFPEIKLIEAGFLIGSEYWVDLSLTWLKESNPINFDFFSEYLNQVFSNKVRYSQKVRHKAKKILKMINHKNF